MSPAFGKFYGIAAQVQDNLGAGVWGHFRERRRMPDIFRIGGERKAFFLRAQRHHADDFLCHPRQAEGDAFQFDGARFDLGDIEQVVDKGKWRESWRLTARVLMKFPAVSASAADSFPRIFASPITPFIGVRISWLILARNSVLAVLAACALSRASCNSFSMRFFSVMSRATFEAPTIRPWLSRTGEMVREMSIKRPSFAHAHGFHNVLYVRHV